MTFEEAYYEWNDLRDLISSWEDETAVTPYSLVRPKKDFGLAKLVVLLWSKTLR